MSVPLNVTCPECATSGQVRPEDAGCMVSCQGCKSTFRIPSHAGRRVIDATVERRSVSGIGSRLDPELKNQLICLVCLFVIVAIFGRDWLPSSRGGNASVATRRARSPGSEVPSVDGTTTATPTKAAAEKLQLASDDDADISPLEALDRRLPPVQPLIRRRAMPFDSPQAIGVRAACFVDNMHAMTVHATERGNLLRKWVIDTGAPIGQPVLMPNGRDFHLRVSPNGSRLAVSVSPNDQGLMLLNTRTGVTIRTKTTKTAPPVSAPVWKGDGTLFYGSSLGTIESWDILTEENMLSLSQGQAVSAVGHSAEGGYLISGDSTGEIRLWSLPENGRYAASYRKLKAPIGIIETRKTGDEVLVLAAAGEQGKTWECHIFDLATQETVHSLSLSGEVTSLAVSSDWRRIVTGNRQGQVVVWDTLTGDELETASVHLGEITTVAIANDNSCVMSGCYASRNDVTVRLRPLPAAMVPTRKVVNTETRVPDESGEQEEDTRPATEDLK